MSPHWGDYFPRQCPNPWQICYPSCLQHLGPSLQHCLTSWQAMCYDIDCADSGKPADLPFVFVFPLSRRCPQRGHASVCLVWAQLVIGNGVELLWGEIELGREMTTNNTNTVS